MLSEILLLLLCYALINSPHVEVTQLPGKILTFYDGYTGNMGQISIKTTNPKCRLYWCLIEFILAIQSVMLVFSTPLLN